MDIIRGNIDLWADAFPHQLLPDVFEIVLSAWERLKASPEKPQPDDHEVPLTQRFRPFITRDRKARKLPFTIWRESPEDDPASSKEKGRIDLRLLHGWREEVYFAFECKRLNVVNKGGRSVSLSSAYVGNNGMMRFITGQYSLTLPEGGMIGYVLDGDVARAKNSVNTSIRNKCRELKMNLSGELSDSSIRPADDQVSETLHHLNSGKFLMHHLLLPA
jgi:hypothetical protein